MWLVPVRMRVQSLASLSGLRIRVAVAVALIRPLVWELPYATEAAVKRKKRKKKKLVRMLSTAEQWLRMWALGPDP